MKTAILLSLGLAAMTAMPAFADGYRDAPPPNRGPAPLSVDDKGATYHSDDRKTVYIRREVHEAPRVTSTSCGCCCPSVSYSTSYTTEPVVVRQYTRTYTRLAPPSCGHGAAYSHGSHPHKGHHGSSYQGANSHHGGGYHHEGRYEGAAGRYEGRYASGPVYPENTVIWSSDGSHRERTGYTARRDEYSYYQARHGNPRIIYRD